MLNDFRKLLFGAKSVAKSAANKAVDAGKEAGEELVDKSGEFIEKAAETAGELYEKASDKANELYLAAKDKVDDITESIWETAGKQKPTTQPSSNVTPDSADDFIASSVSNEADTTPKKDPLLDRDEPFPEKEPLYQEETVQPDEVEEPSEFQKKTAELKSKLKEAAEDVGAKLAEKGSEAIDRARETGSKLKEKFDSLVDKAQEEAEKDRLEKEAIQREAERQRAEWQKRAADKSSESTLGGMGSFFEKAQRFAEGDYHNTGGKNPTDDDPNVLELKPDPNYKKDKKEGKVPGMDDLDGDGNELIDDAIIDKD